MAVTKFAQHGLVRLGYEVSGEGTPEVLVLHGLLQDRVTMRPLTDELAERMSVIAMDLRGHGGSSAVHGLDLKLQDLVGDALVVLDAAEVESDVIVVGVELGAVIAAELQLTYPDRVREMVLINYPTGDMLVTEAITEIADLAYREQVEQAVTRWLNLSWGDGWRESVPKPRAAAARRSAGAIHPMLMALAQAGVSAHESLSLPGGAPFADDERLVSVVEAIEISLGL